MPDASDVIEKWTAEHPEPDAPPSPAVVETPAVETPAAPVEEPVATQTPAPRYTLDDELPDDPRLPPSMRGKSIATLVEYNNRERQLRESAAYEKNSATERAEAYKIALELLSKEVRGGKPAPPAASRASEDLRKRGIEPNVMYTDADRYTDAAADVTAERAADRAKDAIKPELENANERLARLERRELEQNIRGAFLAARPENIPAAEWESNANAIANKIAEKNLNVLDPDSYRFAAQLADVKPRAAAKPAATPPAAAAPAPPVGNGQAPPPARKSQVRVSPHVRGAFNEVTEVLKGMGIDRTTDAILEKMRDEDRYRGMFEQ